jgi:hypothetical protein
MLAAPPRANTGSLATSMASTIAPHVRTVFISGLPGSHVSSHARSIACSRLGKMTDAWRLANAHQVDRHPERIAPDARRHAPI